MSDRPGKFQGEPPYVPYFWDKVLKGLAYERDDTVYKFIITSEDVAQFPELKVGARIFLAESTDGFVFHELLPPKRTN